MAMNGAYFNDLDAAGQQSALANIPGSATTDYILSNLNVPSGTKADIGYGWNPDRVLARDGKVTPEIGKILIPIVQAGVTTGKCQRVWLAIGGAATAPFKNIQTILDTGGPLKSTLLANFRAIVQAVKDAGAKDIGFDMDYGEDPRLLPLRVSNVTSALYDELKCPVTFCANQRLEFGQSAWIVTLRQVYANLGRTQCVVGCNLQTYAGGTGNVPAEWVDAIKKTGGTGVTDPAAFVWPVVSCDDTAQPVTPAAELAQKLKGWQSKGASLWAMQPLGQKPADLKAYSAAIAQGIA
ncbi:MAG TPA: hypothetical protein VKP66_01685, partial [Steroidobacteraceae bacterium]|nr:hypothetical protein [Steroidobacteraceae bacterium]